MRSPSPARRSGSHGRGSCRSFATAGLTESSFVSCNRLEVERALGARGGVRADPPSHHHLPDTWHRPDFLPLGLQTGAGEARQSGWEERVYLREVLKARPAMRVLIHMAAQFDYKAQWLTWVPFDHYWDHGKVWRCARLPLSRPGRPPLLVEREGAWRADVQMIQTAPFTFQNRKDRRVCIRWDLESSPWRCCPHSSGVGYVAQGTSLTPLLLPYNNGSAALLMRLASAATRAAVRPREAAYDVCQEGAFFHAGLEPHGPRRAPACTRGTWALQDDMRRFAGSLSLLSEECRSAQVTRMV